MPQKNGGSENATASAPTPTTTGSILLRIEVIQQELQALCLPLSILYPGTGVVSVLRGAVHAVGRVAVEMGIQEVNKS